MRLNGVLPIEDNFEVCKAFNCTHNERCCYEVSLTKMMLQKCLPPSSCDFLFTNFLQLSANLFCYGLSSKSHKVLAHQENNSTSTQLSIQ
ncbi:CLUMA_CG003120, isoform A [Clunio marinus]|uniref:CLUMA_CG003120, isoform A n=1 Tax=Clunio marinus TaxID=568069 RepID=A0A1J1HPP1_9DIPT|nr:CLUMA_CG003120, isoform A [Clunio marinus]